ncbi:MAG TPA: CHAT domain-containing protein, partial [Solirubrobacteraceae bacterium]|nr:CHAT domain-containing protein [Solirubrobacteraceae bacterium]
ADRAYDATALSAVREAELTRSGPLHHRAGYARARAGDLDGAVAALERGRAHWLAAALRADDVAGRLPDDLSAADRARLDEALRELREVARLERAFGTFEDMPLRGGEDPLERRARDALATIEELTGVSPGTDVASLAGHLGEGEGLVYLATTAWGSVAILIDGGGARAAFADDLDNAAIGSLVGDGPPRYLAGLLGDTAALDARLEPVLVQLEQTLGALLAGLARERGLRRLTLIPTGLLGLVPLHAMPCAGAQPLLEEIEIAYAPSALSWRVARSRAAAATPDLAFLGVANPLPTDAPLLLAGAEVETIADGFDEALVLAEGDATKAAVHEATPRATHVHLACHGEYDPDRPLATHLKLADGGTLTLHELLDRADFAGVRLVTAIACQSAMTRLDRAPDEVLGFPAGFLSAGAAGVVAALWPVEDLPAALVATQLFARQRDGLAPAAALAAAERWLRTATNADVIAYLEQHPRLAAAARVWIALAAAAPGTRPYEHPRHWAAYVLVGA